MHIVIVGNGITGITAARTVRALQPDWEVSVISAEADYFFSRPSLMYVFMGHLRFEDTQPYEPHFWTDNRITLRRLYVTRVLTDEKRLLTSDGQFIRYDKLLLALGSTLNTFNWPGQDLPGVQGMVTRQDLDLLETNIRGVDRAVVIGGGLVGIELCEMLHSRGITVTFLVREKHYMDYLFPEEESMLLEKEIVRHGIDLRLETGLDRIEAGPNGRATAVVTRAGERIPCGLVGLTTGVRPNVQITEHTRIRTAFGILVNDCFETSVEDVYAAGDCAEFKERLPGRPITEQLWYSGREHGRIVGRNLAGQRTRYEPGVFFNSAKFFDIEYQTYGSVPAKPSDDTDSVYWEHPSGRQSLRVTFRKDGRAVAGFSALGLRLRQDVCTRWIEEGRTLEYVTNHLIEANFDPEFAIKQEFSSLVV